MIRVASWGLMTVAAAGVAGYALFMVLAAGARGEFVAQMFSDDPLAAAAHLGGGGVALFLGALQFSRRLRARYLAWHRWAGRVYVLAVAISGSSAFFLALTTPGGPAAQFGFAALAVAWLVATAMAWLRIRAGQVALHRQWMVRSYALTLAAVALRVYLPAALINGVPFEAAYPAIAWLCWVPNLVIAEWLVLPWLARQPAR